MANSLVCVCVLLLALQALCAAGQPTRHYAEEEDFPVRAPGSADAQLFLLDSWSDFTS